MGTETAYGSVEAVWRIESPRLVAGLLRLVRDVERAEDLAQDALVAALERWPESGVPPNPGAWLMTTAKNRALDELRRASVLERKNQEIGRAQESLPMDAELDAVVDDGIEDDLLRLIFLTCHPLLQPPAQLALTLRLVGGLTTPEVARALLLPETTLAQRIVRAKKTLRDARAEFEVPDRRERDERLTVVLGVVYLIFNEGYAATSGRDWMRPTLCDEAMRLGRILAGLCPHVAEVHGLLALMELQASRAPARRRPDGAPVLLLDQDRARWDRLLIGRGLASLERAQAQEPLRGPYTLQAALAACHARARTAEATDWARIVATYDELAERFPSPVVELNQAVAVGMAHGPQAGLELVERLGDEPALQGYHLLPAVRGDLLVKVGRLQEARQEFERAAGMTANDQERHLLLTRAAGCQQDGSGR